MPAATGIPLPSAEKWRDAFNPLWDDPASAEGEPLAGFDAEKARAFAELLIGRVADSPTPDALRRARLLLPLLARPGDPLPAELNFLVLLRRHPRRAGRRRGGDLASRPDREGPSDSRPGRGAAIGAAVAAPAYAEVAAPAP